MGWLACRREASEGTPRPPAQRPAVTVPAVPVPAARVLGLPAPTCFSGPRLARTVAGWSVAAHPGSPLAAQVDEEASIRANTTVLLGNLAPNLSGEAPGAPVGWRGLAQACIAGANQQGGALRPRLALEGAARCAALCCPFCMAPLCCASMPPISSATQPRPSPPHRGHLQEGAVECLHASTARRLPARPRGGPESHRGHRWLPYCYSSCLCSLLQPRCAHLPVTCVASIVADAEVATAWARQRTSPCSPGWHSHPCAVQPSSTAQRMQPRGCCPRWARCAWTLCTRCAPRRWPACSTSLECLWSTTRCWKNRQRPWQPARAARPRRGAARRHRAPAAAPLCSTPLAGRSATWGSAAAQQRMQLASPLQAQRPPPQQQRRRRRQQAARRRQAPRRLQARRPLALAARLLRLRQPVMGGTMRTTGGKIWTAAVRVSAIRWLRMRACCSGGAADAQRYAGM